MTKDKYYNFKIMNRGYGKTYHEMQQLITNLQQSIEKLNDDKRGMLVQLYKANDEKDKIKQENERLNNCIDDQERVINDLTDNRDLYKILFKDYKSRCEKAIEYINDILYPIGSCVNGSDLPYESIESLLSILQNGSEDSE